MLRRRIVKDKMAQGLMCSLTILSILFVLVMAAGLYLKSAPVLEGRSFVSLITSSELKPMKGELNWIRQNP